MLRSILTGHLLVVRRQQPLRWHAEGGAEYVVRDTAIRYLELTNWAESSLAWVLAHESGTPVPTIHNRLRLARERGFIDKPGIGARR